MTFTSSVLRVYKQVSLRVSEYARYCSLLTVHWQLLTDFCPIVAIIAYAIIAAVIDWVSLLFHVSWIVGLAVILAAFSYNHWQANQQQHPLRQQLRTPAFIQPLWIGFVLITIGLSGTSQTTWEAIIWGILFFVALYNLLRQWLPLGSR